MITDAAAVVDGVPPGGGDSKKSAAISALVQQLREGHISRTELFDKLSRLHRGEAVPGIDADGGRGGNVDAGAARGAPSASV
jgi:hypothetical protein